MPVSLALDMLIAVLLVVAIGYAIQLNRKLSQFRNERAELQKLAETFAEATRKAEESIAHLKASGDELRDGLVKAEGLRDDLAFLIDRGGTAADHLEETVRAARKEGGGVPVPRSSSMPEPKKSDRDEDMSESEREAARAEAERELLAALRAAR